MNFNRKTTKNDSCRVKPKMRCQWEKEFNKEGAHFLSRCVQNLSLVASGVFQGGLADKLPNIFDTVKYNATSFDYILYQKISSQRQKAKVSRRDVEDVRSNFSVVTIRSSSLLGRFLGDALSTLPSCHRSQSIASCCSMAFLDHPPPRNDKCTNNFSLTPSDFFPSSVLPLCPGILVTFLMRYSLTVWLFCVTPAGLLSERGKE